LERFICAEYPAGKALLGTQVTLMKPAQKPAELGYFSKLLFDRTIAAHIKLKLCVTCGHKITCFQDQLSEKEYMISGMCQNCQDSVFGKGGY